MMGGAITSTQNLKVSPVQHLLTLVQLMSHDTTWQACPEMWLLLIDHIISIWVQLTKKIMSRKNDKKLKSYVRTRNHFMLFFFRRITLFVRVSKLCVLIEESIITDIIALAKNQSYSFNYIYLMIIEFQSYSLVNLVNSWNNWRNTIFLSLNFLC